MFIPDDARLRHFASGIAEQRRHSLRKPERAEGDGFPRREDEGETGETAAETGEQISLFSAISAIPLDESGRPLEIAPVDEDGLLAANADIPGLVDDAVESGRKGGAGSRFELVAPVFDRPVPAPEPDPGLESAPSPRSRKRQLREQNSAIVTSLVHRTKKSHAEVNALLNRRVGIQRITEATIAQLERRLDAARRWLEGR
jgi:hypothetical protein